jgi:alpha-tubulin suppressor-like RCC1 family protein
MCAVTSAGAALCWGDNTNEELGNAQVTGFFSATPVQVQGLSSGVANISLGAGYTCAVTTTGGVLCWGGPPDGTLNHPDPEAVKDPAGNAPLTGVAAIAAGYSHACALTTSGTELCWGDNGAGEIGNGTEGNVLNLPTQVLNSSASSPLSGVVQISAGEKDSCVVTGGGGILCWGYNAEGEIGEDTRPHYDSPVPVTGLASGVIELGTGYRHNCAITSTGGVMCWGFNEYGQLGDGTQKVSSVPMAVVGVGGLGQLNLN